MSRPARPIQNITEIPEGQHLAAIVTKSRQIHHEGDERSRTHPGHGYPAHTETVRSVEYIPFAGPSEMNAWVLENEKSREPATFTIIQAIRQKVEIVRSVKLG